MESGVSPVKMYLASGQVGCASDACCTKILPVLHALAVVLVDERLPLSGTCRTSLAYHCHLSSITVRQA